VLLTSGTRLGSYEIISVLGVGGMGEVYLARDTRLGRQVAVKVIPDLFLADKERVARFEREAKMLASVSHPNIAALHGLDTADGRHLLVMELVAGETLADRLTRGAMPPEEALALARQVADALECAHEKGIVHRDLKPANIKVSSEGQVKVLDFGLAKAAESSGAAAEVANSPTLSMMASQAGLILGTAAYMSPEQAKGLPADPRSDIFSFGAVLFEMLTGRQPFVGETIPDILASVLVREPDLTRLPGDLDPRVKELVRRCLEKSRRKRWQAIGDVRAEIEHIVESPQVHAASAAPRPPLWRRAVLLATVAIVASAATAFVVLNLPQPEAEKPLTRFVVPLGQGQTLNALGRLSFGISPDGSTIVFAANGLHARSMSDFEARPIAGADDSVASNPTFSPDGRSVVYWSEDLQLKQIPLEGGAPIMLAATAENPLGMSWSVHGLVYGQSTGIWRIANGDRKVEQLVAFKDQEFGHGPQLLPDGRHVLFTRSTGVVPNWDSASIVVRSLDDGSQVTVVDNASDGRYLASGHLLLARGGTILAAPFDLQRLRPVSAPMPVLESVRRSITGVSGSAHFTVSENGTLVFLPGVPGGDSGNVLLAFSDLKGVRQTLTRSPGAYQFPRLSPNRRFLTFQNATQIESTVWVQPVDGSTAMTKLTFGNQNQYPIWSADGQRITFQSDREGDAGIWWQRADTPGIADRLTRAEPGTAHIPDDWSPDGKHLLVTVKKGLEYTLHVWSKSDGQLRPFTGVRSGSPLAAVFSPDGNRLAYGASRHGTNDTQIFVETFPQSGDKRQLSANAGDNPHHPRWSADGRRLFYVPRVNGFEYVPFSVAPAVGFGNPVPVFRAFRSAPPSSPRTYDFGDGDVVLSAASATPTLASAEQTDRLRVVLNWLDEVKRKAPRP
jgi:serine/threonine protein kinase/Tol biopolymer transport system component